MRSNLISIIMPVYNAEKYVAEAIDSVLTQNHTNWELLIINDGSTDQSTEIIAHYKDSRIRYFSQNNQGVSAARNVGLSKMKGDFFCFLDGDDRLTTQSLKARLNVFQKESTINFVDGRVEKWNEDYSRQISTWIPNFRGDPLEDLVTLTGKSFFGPSWMIKRKHNKRYQMTEGLTHGEDLLFYISLAQHGKAYSFTTKCCLQYRVHQYSAMSNLHGLAKGYLEIGKELKQLNISRELIKKYTAKRKSIILKSYLRAGKLFSALLYYMKPDRF